MFDFGKKAAIKKYHNLLGPALVKRYGGMRPYTQLQVELTIDALCLSRKYIDFAYLMFCDSKSLDPNVFSPAVRGKMFNIMATAFGGGLVGAAADSFAGGDGGGGGGE